MIGVPMQITKPEYIIVDLFDGAVYKTKNAEVAYSYAIVDDYFVVNPTNMTWLIGDRAVEIKEI